jgi:hypothetical protein
MPRRTGLRAVNNPLLILQTLDRHLTKPAEITIFGRAALALGFPNSPAAFATTNAVDAILPLAWLAAEDENMDFWQAQQKTNAELDATHADALDRDSSARSWRQFSGARDRVSFGYGGAWQIRLCVSGVQRQGPAHSLRKQRNELLPRLPDRRQVAGRPVTFTSSPHRLAEDARRT